MPPVPIGEPPIEPDVELPIGKLIYAPSLEIVSIVLLKV
jgi:hypothetical protein